MTTVGPCDTNTSFIARLALEWWRASGPKTWERLAGLVRHYCETNNELEYFEYHRNSAFSAVRPYETVP